jgi:hypothetical protein
MSITHIGRCAAVPLLSVGIFGGVAVGLAAVANAAPSTVQTNPGVATPSTVATPGTLANPGLGAFRGTLATPSTVATRNTATRGTVSTSSMVAIPNTVSRQPQAIPGGLLFHHGRQSGFSTPYGSLRSGLFGFTGRSGFLGRLGATGFGR